MGTILQRKMPARDPYESENPSKIEKAGLQVVKNYETLIQDYQTSLGSMINAAREVDNVIFQYSAALNKFSKSIKNVLRACNNTPGSDENIDDTLKEIEQLHGSISTEFTDFSQVYGSDLIKPFEEKFHQDENYLADQLQIFKTKFGENFKLLQEKEEKLEKMNKNRGRSKKDDKKRMELQTEINQRREALETYTKDKLKKSVTEQRQRYVFLSKKHISHVNKLKLLFEQCQGHTADCHANLETDLDASVSVDKQSEFDKYFPAPRKSIYVTEDSHDRVASPQSDYTLTQSEASEELIPPKPSGPPPSNTKNKKMVKATHGFQGGDATQLKIEPGDYIQLLIPQPRDGWHYGENDRTGLKGWFPIKYTIKV